MAMTIDAELHRLQLRDHAASSSRSCNSSRSNPKDLLPRWYQAAHEIAPPKRRSSRKAPAPAAPPPIPPARSCSERVYVSQHFDSDGFYGGLLYQGSQPCSPPIRTHSARERGDPLDLASPRLLDHADAATDHSSDLDLHGGALDCAPKGGLDGVIIGVPGGTSTLWPSSAPFVPSTFTQEVIDDQPQTSLFGLGPSSLDERTLLAAASRSQSRRESNSGVDNVPMGDLSLRNSCELPDGPPEGLATSSAPLRPAQLQRAWAQEARKNRKRFVSPEITPTDPGIEQQQQPEQQQQRQQRQRQQQDGSSAKLARDVLAPERTRRHASAKRTHSSSRSRASRACASACLDAHTAAAALRSSWSAANPSAPECDWFTSMDVSAQDLARASSVTTKIFGLPDDYEDPKTVAVACRRFGLADAHLDGFVDDSVALSIDIPDSGPLGHGHSETVSERSRGRGVSIDEFGYPSSVLNTDSVSERYGPSRALEASRRLHQPPVDLAEYGFDYVEEEPFNFFESSGPVHTETSPLPLTAPVSKHEGLASNLCLVATHSSALPSSRIATPRMWQTTTPSAPPHVSADCRPSLFCTTDASDDVVLDESGLGFEDHDAVDGTAEAVALCDSAEIQPQRRKGRSRWQDAACLGDSAALSLAAFGFPDV